MRSSKSRSRSKANRPRTLGNIVNRVFDSSGPEGKVRGTPQQIIEKYQTLARDAQLSNDRVAAENFLQHAEHYTRLLAEAMREMAAEQESRGQYGAAQNGGGHSGAQNGQSGWQNPQTRNPDQRGQDQRGDYARTENVDGDQPFSSAHDVMGGDAVLVDLPESAQPVRKFEPRPPRNDQPRNDQPRNDQRRNERRDQPREPHRDQQRDERRPVPQPQLRFDDSIAAPVTGAAPAPQAVAAATPVLAPSAIAVMPPASIPVSIPAPASTPVFQQPAAIVAQLNEAPPAKPRAPRARKPDAAKIDDDKPAAAQKKPVPVKAKLPAKEADTGAIVHVKAPSSDTES